MKRILSKLDLTQYSDGWVLMRDGEPNSIFDTEEAAQNAFYWSGRGDYEYGLGAHDYEVKRWEGGELIDASQSVNAAAKSVAVPHNVNSATSRDSLPIAFVDLVSDVTEEAISEMEFNSLSELIDYVVDEIVFNDIHWSEIPKSVAYWIQEDEIRAGDRIEQQIRKYYTI